MKRLIALTALSMCVLSVTAFAADTEKMMTDIAAKARNSVATMSFAVTSQGQDGKPQTQTVTGQAICIDASGIFITTYFDASMDPKMLKNKDGKEEITLTLPGADGKTIKASFMGIDLVSSLGFVQADAADVAAQKVVFTPVEFTDAPIKIGQPVVSAGVMAGDGNRTLYLGAGYVSAVLHIPGPLVYVTGGKMTNLCSPVFGADGKAVGLIARQLPLMSRMESNQGLIPAPTRGEEETAFFTPTEDFAQALKKENMPKKGEIKRVMWIGIFNFSPVNEDYAAELMSKNKVDIKLPAIMAQQVIPGEPAAEKGLKDGDIIMAINGQKLDKLANPNYARASFLRQLMKLQDKGKVDLTVLTPDQGAKERTITVAFKSMPTTIEEAPRLVYRAQGLQLRERVLPLDQYLLPGAIAEHEGLVVEAIIQNSPADKAQLKQGDVITKVDNTDVKTVADYQKIVDTKKGQSVTLQVFRDTDKLPKTIVLDVPQQ